MLHVKQSWRYTALCSIDNEQDTASIYSDQGRRRLWFRRRTDVSLLGSSATWETSLWATFLMASKVNDHQLGRCFLLIN